MGLKRTTNPDPLQVVTAEEARKQLSLPPKDGSHDTHVQRLIAAAVETVERATGRALLTQTWRLTIDSFPGYRGQRGCLEYRFNDGEIILPRPPLVSVTSIEYVDENGDDQTLDADAYQATTDREPARIAPAYGTCWPVTRRQREAVRVTYDAGYGADAASVPQPIRHAILLIISHWFHNREAVTDGTGSQVPVEFPMAANYLIEGYRTGVDPECYRLAE